MRYKTASCILCPYPKSVTAEQQQWLIHLANHREELIKYLAENFTECILCDLPLIFSDKKNFINHLRWNHSKKSLIDWFYKNMVLRPSLIINSLGN